MLRSIINSARFHPVAGIGGCNVEVPRKGNSVFARSASIRSVHGTNYVLESGTVKLHQVKNLHKFGNGDILARV